MGQPPNGCGVANGAWRLKPRLRACRREGGLRGLGATAWGLGEVGRYGGAFSRANSALRSLGHSPAGVLARSVPAVAGRAEGREGKSS